MLNLISLERFLLQRQRKHYHNSIETLSIGAWWKIKEENDFKWLHKNLSGKTDKSLESSKIWEKVEDSYLQFLGQEEEQEELTRLRVKLHCLNCDRIITGKRMINNHIAIVEGSIQTIENEISSKDVVSNLEAIEHMEDDRPIFIDIWELSVLRFHNRVKHLTEKRNREVLAMKKNAA